MRTVIKNRLHRLVNYIKLLSLEMLIVLVAFSGSFFLVLFFVRRVFFDKKQNFDLRVFDYLKDYVSASTTEVMNFFTFFGGQYFLVPANILLALYAFYIKKDKWFGIKISAVAISSLVLMFSLKILFNRPRPMNPLLQEVSGLSFPSGHAFMSFVFFGLLIYMVNKKTTAKWLRYSLITLLLIIVFFIGISRIYLRVHYTSDVLAGFSLGLMWLVISLAILNRMEKLKAQLPAVN
jgi:undecaprenyl-diphosphatase